MKDSQDVIDLDISKSTYEDVKNSDSPPQKKEEFEILEFDSHYDTPECIGNCRAYCYIKSNPRFIFGPEWKCYIVTSSIITILTLGFLIFVATKYSILNAFIGIFLLFLQSFFYFMM